MTQLIQAIQTAIKFTERKDTSAITSHVLLECENNTLKITALNYEIGYEVSLAFENDDFCATANASDLLSVIKGVKGNEAVKFAVTDNELTIEISKNKSKFIGFEPADYPKSPKTDVALTFEDFDMEPLFKILPAADKNNPKMELNGVYFNGDVFAATNTKIFKIISTKYAPLDFDYIIPRTFLSVLKTLKLDTAKAFFTKDFLVLEVLNERFYTRLIDGKYVDYNRIPTCSPEISLNIRADLMLTILNKFKSKEIKIIISPDSLKFETIEAADALNQSFETNEFKTTKTDKAPPIFEIAFQSDFIKAAISDKNKDLNMVFSEPNMPFAVRNDNACSLIMPYFL